VSFTAVRTSPQDTLLQFDFSNGMDENLTDSLNLIRIFEKTTGSSVSYSSYNYIKEGNKDTGGKIRRLELNFDSLKTGTKYVVELGAGVKSNNGSTLGIKKIFEFTTGTTAAGGLKPVEQGIDSSGGKISGNGAAVDIPAASLDSKVKVFIELLADTSKLPLAEKSKLISDVVEITTDKTANFKKPVIITLKFDKSKVDTKKQNIGIHYLDEKAGKWIALNNIKVDLTAGTVSGEVSHFTKFAVIAVEKSELSDIKGHWSEKYITVLVGSGAIGGYPDGTFKPDRGISRAEFVTILVKAFQLPAQNGKVFDDTANHWGKQFIATAAANGVVSGYSDTAFGPDDPITREQMTVMIVKAAGLKAGSSQSISFKDGDQISSWAAEAVSVSASQSIVNGYPDSTFRPRGTATRAEAVKIIAQTQKIAI
ncbi:MAG: S-layer homology domain-containing protein, partial [Syntrophomonadaceae bacterium]|nr:S-layer homology domain-containing protein [Syntrophomonadaceae bacterium]